MHDSHEINRGRSTALPGCTARSRCCWASHHTGCCRSCHSRGPCRTWVQNPIFGLFFLAIHGFRMQLFFFISGYFTMMMWQTRGLKALLKQRFQRVFIPCMLGLLSIVPAVRMVSFHFAESGSAAASQRSPGGVALSKLLEAVKRGDATEVNRQLDAGANPNELDPELERQRRMGRRCGDVPITKVLLEHGADVNGQNKDGSRPLHGAALLGRAR